MGLAALQATSIKTSMDTAKRSQGLWLVEEIASRMRVNEAGLTDGYTTAAAAACTDTPAKYCSDYVTGTAADNCSANEMAAYDVWEVFCGHDDALGVTSNSNAAMNITDHTITCDTAPCSAQSNFTISLQWTAKSIADSATNSSGYAESDTQNISITIRP
jgi:type IV pilus assembly protein PilV